jgi:hypothetical protein
LFENSFSQIFQPLETFFPIIGKLPKIFSNHWKNRTGFSSHWKKTFQSLENPPVSNGPADCASLLPNGCEERKDNPSIRERHSVFAFLVDCAESMHELYRVEAIENAFADLDRRLAPAAPRR